MTTLTRPFISSCLVLLASMMPLSAETIRLRASGMQPAGTNAVARLNQIGKNAAVEECFAQRGLSFRPWDGTNHQDYSWIYEPEKEFSFRVQAARAPDCTRAVLCFWDWFGNIVYMKPYKNLPCNDTITVKPECHGVWLVTLDAYGDETAKSIRSRLIKSFGTPVDATADRKIWQEKNDYLIGSCFFPRRYYRWGQPWKWENAGRTRLTPSEGIDRIVGLAARGGLTMLRSEHFGRTNPGKPESKPDWQSQEEVLHIFSRHAMQMDYKLKLFPECFIGGTLERNAAVFSAWEEDLDFLITNTLAAAATPVALVELGNEPAHQEFWAGTREQYQFLVNHARNRILAANPKMPVVHGASCPPGADLAGEKLADPAAFEVKRKAQEAWYLAFYRDMAKLGDLWAYHFHGPLNVNMITWRTWERTALSNAGFAGNYIQTEGGRNAWRPDFESSSWMGALQKIIYSWSCGERGWLQYSFTYEATPSRYLNSRNEGWTLIHAYEFAPKFQYGALAAFVHTLAGCTLERTIFAKNLDGAPTLAVAFRHPKGRMIAWFGTEPGTELNIRSDGKTAVIIDPMGNVSEPRQGGEIRVRCEQYPQYLLLSEASRVEATDLNARESTAPGTAHHPAEVDMQYSLDNPQGPVFPDEIKQQQREEARRIRGELQAAFEAGKNSYTIPPGNYRFGKETWGRDGPICPLEFRGMKRDAAHPFRIIAQEATFWFDLPPDQAPHAHFALGFVDCSNLTLEGATLDRDPRGCMEGRITQIDYAGNRIEIKATKGSLIPPVFSGKLEQRIIPFNSNGTFCTAMYALQQTAPARLMYRNIEPGTETGRYWVNFPAESVLLKVNREPAWRRTYGEAGTLQVGDGLCLLYTTTLAVTVRDCTGMSFIGVKNYISKGGVRELGGGGGHLWKDCYFGPRPGTCHWQGGDGILTGCMERGCTYDGITILHTTDDLLDIHGFWGYIEKAEGRTIVIQKDHQMPAQAGDELNFFDAQTGTPVGKAVVAAVKDQTLTLDREAAPFASTIAENPQRQSNAWEIRNSTFVDCYQRLLVQGGNGGTLRDNHFIRVGSCIELHSNFFTKNEGGICRDISILNNTFEDVAIHPGGTTLSVGFQSLNHKAQTPLLSNITVRGNRFINSGQYAIEFGLVAGGEISGNTFIDPGRPRSLSEEPPGRHGTQPVQLRNCTGITLRANRLESQTPIPPSASTGNPLVDTSDGSRDIDAETAQASAPESSTDFSP